MAPSGCGVSPLGGISAALARMKRSRTQPHYGQKLGHLDSRAGRPAPPEILQTLSASGREAGRPLTQVKIPVQLSQAGKANPEPVVARPNEGESSLVNDGLNRLHGCIDKRLENWIYHSSDRLAFLRRADGNERSIPLMRLDQDEHAVGQQVLPGSLEGMDHALDRDSSKRQRKSATSNASPPTRRCSADPIQNETLRMPSDAARCRARAIFAGSGSMATTLEARGASWRVSLPSPHPISTILRPSSAT